MKMPDVHRTVEPPELLRMVETWRTLARIEYNNANAKGKAA
jgi:hypothetical protein